jgi:3,4-dihydroxy 2-butanone 4-phosphate synthase/GTP cyclohydrolase II
MIKYITIEEALIDLKKGQKIIVVDDEGLDNECHYIAAAKAVIDHGLLTSFCPYQTIPTIVLGYEKYGLITGVKKNINFEYDEDFVNLSARNQELASSAFLLEATLQALLNKDATVDNFRQGGEFQVLSTRQGGILKRAAPAEAIIDLCWLANQPPVGLLYSLVDDDGRSVSVESLAHSKETYPLFKISDLIYNRRQTDVLIERVAEAKMPTKYGDFMMVGFINKLNGEHHVALVKGDVTSDEPVLIRVHSECLTGDSFGSQRCDCGEQLHTAMRRIEKVGRGIILYMRQEGRGIGLINKIRAYALQDQGLDTVEANIALGFPDDLRDYGIGAQMLVALGVKRMNLMTNNPKKIHGLSGYGIEIVNRVKIQLNHNERNEFYMRTKKDKMGHILDFKKQK